MKQVLIVLLLSFALALSACTGDGGKQLYETAKFEEVQNNREHARELYEEIVKKHPESEYAKKAAERLKELKDKK
jgi:outer membrane protein assembly factor BamD (BamD/ComL family)